MKTEIPRIPSSEITPEAVYHGRRAFLAGLGLAAGGALLAGCGAREAILAGIGADGSPAGATPDPARPRDELGEAANRYEEITQFNNYYEFSDDKQAVAGLAAGFQTEPWTVRVGGLVRRPTVFGIEDLTKRFPPEERVYRLRCVEAWSMVIPWLGFPLASLLAAVEPRAEARYVRFEALLDPDRLPGQRNGWYDWPYVEGLRLDEAMHPLALLVTGLYGQALPAQNGAPLRLAVPWKYGFKGIKGIVKIDLVAEQPRSLWMAAAPEEYGFYANVNPAVSHPRWSQATERRIGEAGRRKTLPFNGYEAQVAGLYAGMDLAANY